MRELTSVVSAAVEAEFQQHVAVRRRPILLLVFCFDVICYLFRMVAKFVRTDIMLTELVRGIFPQLCNMMLLYTFLGLLNRRSRRLGDSAARQVIRVAFACNAWCQEQTSFQAVITLIYSLHSEKIISLRKRANMHVPIASHD